MQYPSLKICLFSLSVILTGFLFSANAQHPVISSIISDIKIDSLKYFVEDISGERAVTVGSTTDTIRSRHKLQPGNNLTFRYLIQKLNSYGLQTDSMNFSTNGKNVIAIQPGTVFTDKPYIICGHYDAMPSGTYAPAADDDGSGVGAVIESARVLSHYNFQHTIIYAIWDEEEQGLVGSAAYATHARNVGDSIQGVLNMDAIAYDGDGDERAAIHTKPIANSVALADTVVAVNTTYNIGLNFLVNNPGATYSDHASFWTKGFSSILIIEDFDNDGNPFYHTPVDKVSHFDLGYFEKLAKLSIASLATLAVPDMTTNISRTQIDPIFNYYPNPTVNSLKIKLDGDYDRIVLMVNDITGKTLMQNSYRNYRQIELNTESLDAGIYFITVLADEKRTVLKVVKN